ncbi:ornithine cyclodeaminase family protein [Pedococcus bigeumensis]|uniref:Ornithine cyclodeaminase family protein n=1 Tax=Pedococcus bigeumensis TaxID=433644 RepID=A0A502D1C0_9MICO|nr:ornithine cyclodeaminase family protein [Pedococcus bigeumensis]TPG19565.1 ornithine cyclodeaminase family protein [Pedococcus bigeumensis]
MRYLSDADVARLLPPPLEAIQLAHAALVALAEGNAEVPPKPAVHPGGASFANAMPAAYPARKLLGCKWISIFPDNRDRGLPAVTGLMVVNHGDTGEPRCVMAAGALTAARTAAVSGACIAALSAPDATVAITGAGVQARSHLRMLAALGRHRVTVFARRSEARAALVDWAASAVPDVELEVSDEVAATVRDAEVVVTGLAIGLTGSALEPDHLRPDVLLLPLDYASSVGADLASAATLSTDHVAQFETVRGAGSLGDYPATDLATGTLLGRPRSGGRVVCQNLGNGLSDLMVASAVADAAEAQDAGQLLDTAPA